MRLPVIALVLADGRTPTGGHAHSAGLEPALRDGLLEADVPSFLAGRLRTVGVTDAAIAAAAALSASMDRLLELDGEFVARCPSPALRAAASALGRGLLRTAETLLPHAAAITAYRHQSVHTPRPVAMGVVARAAGLPPEETATVLLYDDIAGAAASAVKLLPVDAAVAAGWVAALSAEIEGLALDAAERAAHGDIPSLTAPLIDHRSLVHQQNSRRLFAT